MGGSSPSPSPTNSTVTQTQSIPQYQQDFSQQNMNLAQSLGTQPYPVYNAPIVADLNPTQQEGLYNAANGSYGYVPLLQKAQGAEYDAMGQNPLAGGDPTQNAQYGAGAVAAANPMAAANTAVNGMLNSAGTYAGMGATQAGAASAYGAQGAGVAQAATGANPVGSTTAAVNALDPGNQGVIQRYMNPYVQASLAPQLQQAQITQDRQQQQINGQATSAGAFGDARQGVMNGLQNYFGQQTNAGIEAQGYNTAYTNAQAAALAQQGQQQQLGTLGVNEQTAQANLANSIIGAGNLQNNAAGNIINAAGVGVNAANARTALANTGVNEQGQLLNQQTSAQNYQKLLQGQQAQTAALGESMAKMSQQNQSQVLAAANAEYNAGKIQQDNQQNQLSAAYQQYVNQANWPFQMLNVQESALSNNPYNIASATTVPTNSNNTTANLANFATLAGALGTASKAAG